MLSILYDIALYANFNQFLAFYIENGAHTQILKKKVENFFQMTLSTTVKAPRKKTRRSKIYSDWKKMIT